MKNNYSEKLRTFPGETTHDAGHLNYERTLLLVLSRDLAKLFQTFILYSTCD